MRLRRRLFATLIAFTLTASTAFASDHLQVGTDKGKVAGTLTTDGQVRAFKGIPYAAPPIGNLRWAPPEPAPKWHDTLAATSFGHHCYQTNPFADMSFADAGPSEDCLTLNIWTPAKAEPGTLPVMVWIHGGGYTAGSASEPRHDGQFLAHHNVVIVTLNYRLGIFGFYTHPDLAAESPHHAAGNYGLLDQAAALAWVKRNIAAFGGDPNNVTIFGESAGSFSVSSLMASPLSKNLISKAIGESGAAFHSSGLPYPALAVTEQQDAAFGQTALHASTIADLRKLSADDILAAASAKSAPPPPRFGPVVDGYFLPQAVPEIYAAGQQAHVPLLAGWNADEVRSAVTMNPVQPTTESFSAQATKDFGSRAPEFLSLYNSDVTVAAGDFVSDRFIAYSTWAWLEAQVNTGVAPVYRYRFDLAAPADKFHPAGTGAFHSDDIEYVFGTLDSRQQATIRPEDRALSRQMQIYWTNFARNGNPNSPDVSSWPQYRPTEWQVMHLDTNSEARPDSLRPRYLFLQSVWAKPVAP